MAFPRRHNGNGNMMIMFYSGINFSHANDLAVRVLRVVPELKPWMRSRSYFPISSLLVAMRNFEFVKIFPLLMMPRDITLNAQKYDANTENHANN